MLYRYQIKKKDVSGIVHNTEKIMSKFCDWYLDPVGPAKNSRQHWQMLVQEYSDGYPVVSNSRVKYLIYYRIIPNLLYQLFC